MSQKSSTFAAEYFTYLRIDVYVHEKQVNKKTQDIMRTNLLNDLSNVVKKGTGLACSWSQVGRMSEGGAIEHPLSTHSAPFGTRWKPAGNKQSIPMRSFTRLAAMVTLLLTLACGQMWGADRGFWDTGGGSVRFYRNGSVEYWAQVNNKDVSDFSLGNIDSDGGLVWTDAWAKVWGGNDIFNSITLYWRVKGQDAGSGPSYSNYGLNWNKNLDSNNQYWDVTMQSQTCSTTGLAAGNYEVEFYFSGAGKDGNTYYLSNNGGNYHANFTLRRKITYHDTGKTSGSAPATEWFSGAATVRDNTGLLQKTGYVFAGWATSAERAAAGTIDHEPGESNMSVTLTADLDLYPVWKPGSYFISLTGSSTNGVKNTTDFISSNSLTNTATEVNGVTFSKSYYKTSNSQTSIKAQYQNANRFLVYDTKSTTTKIRVYVKNTDTSSKNLYYYLAKESSTSETDQTVTLTAGEAKVINIDASNSKGTRFILSNGQYDKIFIAQIIAIESGTTLPLPGQAGYELAFPGRVASHFLNINGIEIAPHNTLKWNYGDELRLQSGSGKYVKFTTTAATQLQVKIQKNKGFYVCTDKSNPSTTGFLTEGSSAGTKNIYLDAAGTYYIMGETSSNTQIDKISFAAHTACTAPTGLAAGSTTYNGTTFTVTDGTNANNYEFYVSTSSTAPTASSTPTYTTTSKTLAVDDLNKNTTYYAWVRTNGGYFHKSAWTALTGTTFKTLNAYDITYNCDGATYGCPEDGAGLALPSPLPSAPFKAGYNFDGWFTNSGKTVEAVAGDELSDDVTLYAKWTKVYASTKDFTTSATQGTVPNQKTITTSYTSYTPFRVDNFFFGATNKLCFETGNADAQYNGWKFQYSGSTIKFYVENDCDVTVAMGANAGCSIKYTPIDGVETTENLSTTANTTTTKGVEAGTMVTLTTTSGSTVTLKSITITDRASCSAPTSPSISGTTSYTAGETISLTASATGTSGSTTYAWYLGDPASSGVEVQAASTSGATFSKSAVVADEGTYYCVISNGAGCTVTTSQAITVSCATAPVAVTSLTCSAQTINSLTYTWTKASNASGYTATLYSDSDCKSQVASQSLGDVATVTFSTLSVGTTYYCKVQSKGNGTVYCVDGGTTSAVSGRTKYQYAISYDKGEYGTGSISGGTKTEGTAFTLSSEKFTRSGYVQTGWALTDGGSKAYELGGSYTTDAAQTFYPVWSVVYTVTFDSNGGSSVSPITQSTYGGSITMPTAPTKSGYTFVNWMLGGDTFDPSDSYTPTANVTVYATWKETCAGGGGGSTTLFAWTKGSGANITTDETSLNGNNMGTMSTGTSIVGRRLGSNDISNETKGYKLGNNDVAIEIQGTSNFAVGDVVTITGRGVDENPRCFVVAPTTVSTVTSGGFVTSDTVCSDQRINTSADEEYTVVLKSAQAGAKIRIFRNPGKSMWVKAVSVTRSGGGTCYYVTYDGNGATAGYTNDSTAYAEGDDPEVLDCGFTNGSETFLGWNTKDDGTGTPYAAGSTISDIDENITLYAQWGSGYSVTYADGGATSGSVPTDANVYQENDEVTVLGNTGSLVKNGYTFGGWSDGVSTYKADDTFTITDDVTLTAVWTPNDYTITYHLNGASWASAYSAPATYTVGTGATLPVAGNMTNTGYTFDGWYANSDLSTGGVKTEVGTSEYGNKEYWAKWTENTYTITYEANDVSATGSTSDTEGHYVTVADNGFALEDHVFAGWNTAANGSGESYSEGEEIELTDDMTLYAIWADDYNVTWGNVQIGGAGDAVTPNLGGKNYTITATIATWTGDVTDIELGDVTSGVTASITGTTSSPSKTVTITFAVGTSVVGSSINLSLNVPAHGDYGAKTSPKAITIDRCTGGKDEIRFISSNKNDAGDNFANMSTTENTTQYVGSGIAKLIATGSAGLNLANNKIGYRFDRLNVVFKLTTTTTLDVYYNANATNKTFALYSFSSDKELSAIGTSDYSTKSIVSSGITVTNVSFSEGSKSTSAGTNSVSSGVVKLVTAGGIKASYASLAAGYYVLISGSGEEGYLYGLDITGGSGSGKITPTLTWSPAVSSDEDWDSGNNRLNKKTSDADFTFTATQDKNSLGAITYASSNTSVATVNATTGKVHVEGAGDATITATLAESGCYNKATATYAIHVVDDCDDEAGTISTEDLGCDGIRMTVTGHTAADGVSYQWYKVKAEGSDDEVGEDQDNYTATTAGEYYVIVTNTGDRHCAKTSTNTVVVAAKAAVTASKIVDSWYVKNGRRTPDIALVQTTNTTDFTVAFKGSTTIWDPTNSVSTGFGGCPFRLGTDGIIYLDGQSSLRAVPTGMTVGDTTITITAKGCGAGNNQSVDIKLHVQAATDYPSVAYVSLGTAAGAVTDTTAGYYKTAALYKYLDNTLGGGDFDLTAQNAYWSVDEKELKQHYSQFDAILITDDPSTDKSKKVGGKDYSYINAIGCLIDVRPILTMEAYVAKRDNWKAKGITGTPESPNPRQYGMKLQCKQHAIFSGVNSASSNVEVETIDGVDYWTVLMVDSTMSPYTGVAWNEQTAGDQKPALQGFAASSVSEDLLLLGEIKDGALYAGVERQTEPAARLLVLGINAKALPSALTAEGKLILENSLHYLLETDLEKVDDCSNYFTGATDSDWNKSTNWSKGQVPNSPTIRVRILKPCVVSSGTPIKAASVDIATSGKSYHLSGGTCSGKLTINAGGALIVGGEVRSAVAPNFNSVNLKPTTEDDLILNTSSTAQSALILNNDDGDTKATVNLYSLGRFKDAAYQFQYFAVPMTYLDVNPAFAGKGIYTYVWTEASGWERRGYYKGIEAFEGVGITTTFTEAKTYQLKGTLASTEEREITLTTGGVGDGQNIIGNSWLAPINIASLKTGLVSDASIVDKTIYIYCTGHDGESVESGAGETPGQWLAIPIDASGWDAWTGLKVIPAMQGFCIIANSETTLTLNYNDHVRSTASDKLTPYLRAPKRNASHEGIDLIRIRVADSKTHTDLYLFEGESFSEEFDNGWEAKYMSGDGRSAKLYAETAIGPMAVVAQPEYEGTVLGFAPGKETEYTFTFSGPNKDYYLNDLREKKSTLISEDESYMFTFEEGDTNRFYISKTPINAPSVATGTENTGDGAKARKVIYNNHVYIIRAGKVYGIDGTLVVPNMEQK